MLCDFHRIQAWERWLSKDEHGLRAEKDSIMPILRKIAEADCVENFDAALSELSSKPFWNDKLRKWFEGKWLSNKHRWVKAFKSTTALDGQLISTTNGLERKHHELKAHFLRNYACESLSSIVEVIVTKYVPEMYRRYKENNLKMMSRYRKYNNQTPSFLQEKPRKLFEHCMSRAPAKTGIESTDIRKRAKDTFRVVGECKESYEVKFGSEDIFCECFDWKKNQLPCKHMLALLQYGFVRWEHGPSAYINLPTMTLDYDVLSCDFEDISGATMETTFKEKSSAPHQEVQRKIESIQTSCRCILKDLEGFTYKITNGIALGDLEATLMKIQENYKTFETETSNVNETSSPWTKPATRRRGRKRTKTRVQEVAVEDPLPAGLINPDATSCWVNSTVQALREVYKINRDMFVSQDCGVVWALVNLLTQLDSATTAVDPTALLDTVHINCPAFKLGHQQDVCEFLENILPQLNFTPVKIQCVTTRFQCGHETRNAEDMPMLLLPTSATIEEIQFSTVEECLNGYFQIGEYHKELICEECVSENSAVQQSCGWRGMKPVNRPDILPIVLKRYNVSGDGSSVKDTRRIEVNRELNFQGTVYSLVAIQCHYGQSTNSGHYFTYTFERDKSFLLDDRSVKKKDTAAVLKDSNVQKNSYVMWYKKEDRDESKSSGAVYCFCKSPHNGRDMIKCDICVAWYHKTCIRMSEAEFNRSKRRKWLCPLCVSQQEFEDQETVRLTRKRRHDDIESNFTSEMSKEGTKKSLKRRRKKKSKSKVTPQSSSQRCETDPICQRQNLCELPNELLTNIFNHIFAERGNGVYIGILRSVATESSRLQQIIDGLTGRYDFHVNGSLLNILEKIPRAEPNRIFEWSVSKILNLAGKYSGLGIRLEQLLGRYKGWKTCRLVVLSRCEPGWFRIMNVVPGKGGWKF